MSMYLYVSIKFNVKIFYVKPIYGIIDLHEDLRS